MNSSCCFTGSNKQRSHHVISTVLNRCQSISCWVDQSVTHCNSVSLCHRQWFHPSSVRQGSGRTSLGQLGCRRVDSAINTSSWRTPAPAAESKQLNNSLALRLTLWALRPGSRRDSHLRKWCLCHWAVCVCAAVAVFKWFICYFSFPTGLRLRWTVL